MALAEQYIPSPTSTRPVLPLTLAPPKPAIIPDNASPMLLGNNAPHAVNKPQQAMPKPPVAIAVPTPVPKPTQFHSFKIQSPHPQPIAAKAVVPGFIVEDSPMEEEKPVACSLYGKPSAMKTDAPTAQPVTAPVAPEPAVVAESKPDEVTPQKTQVFCKNCILL